MYIIILLSIKKKKKNALYLKRVTQCSIQIIGVIFDVELYIVKIENTGCACFMNFNFHYC